MAYKLVSCSTLIPPLLNVKLFDSSKEIKKNSIRVYIKKTKILSGSQLHYVKIDTNVTIFK